MTTQADIDRWLPRWRELIDAALAAANAPFEDPNQLKALADLAAGQYGHRDSGWVIPLPNKADMWVGRALIGVAQAFCRQPSGLMRQTLAEVLQGATIALVARLARNLPEFNQPVPVLPLRRRRDIDDAED